MVFSPKLGFALAVAVVSNVSLFSMLLYTKASSSTTTTTTTTTPPTPSTPTTTASTTIIVGSNSSSSSSSGGGELSEYEARLVADEPPDQTAQSGHEETLSDDSLGRKAMKESNVQGQNLNSLDDSDLSNKKSELVERNIGQTVRPTVADRRNPVERLDQRNDRGSKDTGRTGEKNDLKTRTENRDQPHPKAEKDGADPEPEKRNAEPKPQEIYIRSENEYHDLQSELEKKRREARRGLRKAQSKIPNPKSPKDVKDPESKKKDPNPGSDEDAVADLTAGKDLLHQGSGKEARNLGLHDARNKKSRKSAEKKKKPARNLNPRPRDLNAAAGRLVDLPDHPRRQVSELDAGPDPRRGDVPPSLEHPPTTPPAEKTVLRRVDSDHEDDRLHSVIATLTDSELGQVDSATAQVLIPALRSLESLVLRGLENLRGVTKRQEQRLQRLEQSQPRRSEVMEAIQVIREEYRRLQGPNYTDQPAAQSPMPSAGSPLSNSSEAVDRLENADDSSGSGEKMVVILQTAMAMTTMITTTTPARTNTTERSDEMIINHIYEMYNSLTSMENKVIELGTRLTSVSTNVYRQRATYVPLEDKVEGISHTQKSLLMRSTMHGLKLSDLEQFKSQAEAVLGSAEGTVEQLDARLEVFTDRMMEEQDEVAIMRDVFSRLEQVSSELKSADSFKAHDVQELKRGYQQIENRLNNMHITLEHSMGNIRYDIKTYLDNMCVNNHLQC